MSNFSHRSLSNVIGSIYDCALDPSQWGRTLAEVSEILGSEKTLLSLNDLQRDEILVDASFGWEPAWLIERRKHAAEIHARLTEWLATQTSLDAPFVASRHLAPHYAAQSAYVRDCLAPLGVVDVAHFFLLREPTRFSELVVARGGVRGAVMDAEIELGVSLLPHLRRAVAINHTLDAAAIRSARLAETLDALRCGVFFLDLRGAVLDLNRRAEALLRLEGSPVECVGSILRARSLFARKELQKAVALAARSDDSIGGAGVAIRLDEGDASPTFAHVLPLASGELRAALRREAAVAVFVDALSRANEEAQRLRELFKLTPAETKVVENLLAGRTLSETAADLGVASSTAKTHLSNIFAKTGVSRQVELARLAARLGRPA